MGVPAEDRMQAFLWRTPLGCGNPAALVFDSSYQPPASRPPADP